jgi:uncharacterized membrane protein
MNIQWEYDGGIYLMVWWLDLDLVGIPNGNAMIGHRKIRTNWEMIKNEQWNSELFPVWEAE